MHAVTQGEDRYHGVQGAFPRGLVPLAIFAGSFLLFWVQPMLGRALLPFFGGSAAVWVVCLAAFQFLLLAGYGYAYAVARLPHATRGRLHLGLLLLACVWVVLLLVFVHAGTASRRLTGVPVLDVLLFLLTAVGLPYTLLAAGSTLVQAWVAEDLGGRGVYRLYAVSNLGSLLGLLAYPLVVEPYVSIGAQWAAWAAGFVVYTAILGRLIRGRGRTAAATAAQPASPPDSPALPAGREETPVALSARLSRPWLWAALPAASSFLLVAVTNHLSTDVTPIPLLWALLLAIFLLSYVVGFSRAGERLLALWQVLAAAALVVAAWRSATGSGTAFVTSVAIGALLVFAAGLLLHGWLYAIRPPAAKLTRYYLAIAAGGAMGGSLASLAAPALFATLAEFPLGLVLLAALAGWFTWIRNDRELRGLNEAILLCCAAVLFLVGQREWRAARAVVVRTRSFYGTLTVTEQKIAMRSGRTGVQRNLSHGLTLHGSELSVPGVPRFGTSYYGPLGGGLALRFHPSYSNGAPMRVGCIGLGIGTMAVYGRTHDLYRFYEINPDVVSLAGRTNLFTYLSSSPARIEVRLGDARRTLEEEIAAGDAPFDVLVVDAYSGDAVPIHLATREAFEIYGRRLAAGGILAVHVSNWHIDLLPLCKAAGRALGMNVRGVVSAGDPGHLVGAAVWVFLRRSPLDAPLPSGAAAREVIWKDVRDVRMITDARGSILPFIRFGAQPPVAQPEIDLRALEALLH